MPIACVAMINPLNVPGTFRAKSPAAPSIDALKARAVIAQGNALGMQIEGDLRAEGPRYFV